MALDERVRFISKLRSRIKRFHDKRLAYIKPFYNSEKAYFFYKAQDIAAGSSDSSHISTTCTCTILLSKWGQLKEVVSDPSKLMDSLLKEPWTTKGLKEDNPYSASFALNALKELGVPGTNEKVRRGVDTIISKIDEEQGGISLAPEAEGNRSAFVTFWGIKALECYRDDFDEKNKIDKAISLAKDWSRREVYRQISYFTADDSDLRNVHQLAFAWASCNSPNRHPPLPREISNLVLATIFSVQQDSGIWKKYYPLFNLGVADSAYVYHFELLMALVFALQKSGLSLRPYLENISKILDWVETRETFLSLPGGSEISGWTIDSNPSVRLQPISWATIEVLYVLSEIDRLLIEIQKDIIVTLLDHDGSTFHQQNDPYGKMIDIKIPGTTTTVLEIVEKKIIEPLKQMDSSLYDKTPKEVCLSAYLFGPPGTSKTSIAQKIASELGWSLLEVDPSHFVPRTDSGLEMRVLEVFYYLECLYNVVILLDELDELVRDREDSDRIGRFWTTLMLPRLNKLRKKGRSVIIGATNYIGKIDEAARRAGRFDLVIPMGPPEPKGKLRLLATMKEGNPELAESWLTEITGEEKLIFEKILYGEVKLLGEQMAHFSLDELLHALLKIKDSLYLNRHPGENPATTNWDIFLRSSEECKRL